MCKKKKKEQTTSFASKSTESSGDLESDMPLAGFLQKKSATCDKVAGTSCHGRNLSLNTSQSFGEEDESLRHDSDGEGSNKSDKTCFAQECARNLFDKKTEAHLPAHPKGQYADLFKDNRNQSLGMKLDEFECSEDNVDLHNEDIAQVEKALGFCLIGYFASKFPGKQALLKLCSTWQVPFQFQVHSSGWLIFKFDSQVDRDSVLNGGPYYIYGRPLLLKIMPTFFEFDDEEIRKLPVWIKLPCLPIECWTTRALSKICSRVGRPISTDKLTLTKERLSFARVLVEVDAASELVHSIGINLPNGKTRMQPVLYEYEPSFCSKCKMIGHLTEKCSAGAKPKDTTMGNKQKVTLVTKAVDKQPDLEASTSATVEALKVSALNTEIVEVREKMTDFEQQQTSLQADPVDNLHTDKQALESTLPIEHAFTEVTRKKKGATNSTEMNQHPTEQKRTNALDAKLKGKTVFKQEQPKHIHKKKGGGTLHL